MMFEKEATLASCMMNGLRSILTFQSPIYRGIYIHPETVETYCLKVSPFGTRRAHVVTCFVLLS